MNSLLDGFLGVFFITKFLETSKNAGGWQTETIKFGELLNWICFDWFSYFFSMGISIPAPTLNTIKFGEACICFGGKSYFFRTESCFHISIPLISWHCFIPAMSQVVVIGKNFLIFCLFYHHHHYWLILSMWLWSSWVTVGAFSIVKWFQPHHKFAFLLAGCNNPAQLYCILLRRQ